MSRKSFALALAVMLTIAGGDLRAQILPDSLISRRIRVHIAQQDRAIEGKAVRQAVRGTLLQSTADAITLSIHPEASPLTIEHNGIYQIDVSRGVSASRTALKHAAGGALAWAAMGTLVEGDVGGSPEANALIWAAGGFVTGAVLGAIFPEESWRRVFRR